LVADNMGHLASVVVGRRLDALNSVADFEQFITTVSSLSFVKDNDLARFFEHIDKRIAGVGKNSASLVAMLQKHRPKGAKCPNSAHTFALDILTGKAKANDISHMFHAVYEQGIPTRTDAEYVKAFVDALVHAKLSMEEIKYFVQVIEDAPPSYYRTYAQAVCVNASKLQDKWSILITLAEKRNSEEVDNMFVQILLDTKPTEKSLNALESLIKGKKQFDYFRQITDDVLGIVEKQKEESKKKGFFSFLRGGDKKPSKDKKKK